MTRASEVKSPQDLKPNTSSKISAADYDECSSEETGPPTPLQEALMYCFAHDNPLWTRDQREIFSLFFYFYFLAILICCGHVFEDFLNGELKPLEGTVEGPWTVWTDCYCQSECVVCCGCVDEDNEDL